MKISKQARREAKQLFRTCVAPGALDEAKTRQVGQHLLRLKPRGYLAILSHFARLVRLEVQRRAARVESAVPLPPELRAKVETGLASVYGTGLSIHYAQNPALIGGLRIKVASDVYDSSVQSRLAALAESF